MNIDNDELRKAIVNYRVMCDSDFDDMKNGAITQEEYSKSIERRLESVIKLFAAQRQALRDEVMAAIGEDIGWEWKPYNEIEDVTSSGLDPEEFEFKVCTICGEHEFHPDSVHICEVNDKVRADLRTAISTLFEGKENK